MTAVNEGQRAGEFLISEAPGSLSRAAITLVSGAGDLVAGTVLAKITASGKYTVYDNAGSDGTETAAAVLYAAADASSADAAAVAIVRLAEIDTNDLTWFDGAIAGDKTAAYADLATAYIIAR